MFRKIKNKAENLKEKVNIVVQTGCLPIAPQEPVYVGFNFHSQNIWYGGLKITKDITMIRKIKFTNRKSREIRITSVGLKIVNTVSGLYLMPDGEEILDTNGTSRANIEITAENVIVKTKVSGQEAEIAIRVVK